MKKLEKQKVLLNIHCAKLIFEMNDDALQRLVMTQEHSGEIMSCLNGKEEIFLHSVTSDVQGRKVK